MKKLLTILTILIVALIAMVGSVNATGKVSASTITAESGNTVTVSIDLGEKSENAQFTLTYDATKLTYDSVDKGGFGFVEVNDKTEGTLKVAAMGSTEQVIKVVFKVKEGVTGETTVNIEEKIPTVETLTATVNLPEKEKEPEKEPEKQPEQQGQQSGSTENETPSTNEEPKTENKNEESSKTENTKAVDKKGNAIKELPKTGTPIFAGVVALIVVVGAVLVIKNRK